MTPNEINSEYKRNFGCPQLGVLAPEILRARFVIHANPHENPAKALLAYNVNPEVISMLTGGKVDPIQPRQKRNDKYQQIVDWCKANHLYQTTAEQIAEIGGISYQTALKFIKDRPDLFYRIKKGLYEVRNPEQVKKEEGLL